MDFNSCGAENMIVCFISFLIMFFKLLYLDLMLFIPFQNQPIVG